MKPPRSLRWLRPALRAFTSLRDVSLRRNLRLSLPLQGALAASGQPFAWQEQSTGLFPSGLSPVGAQSAWERPGAD
jgi:hypothetical protein